MNERVHEVGKPVSAYWIIGIICHGVFLTHPFSGKLAIDFNFVEVGLVGYCQAGNALGNSSYNSSLYPIIPLIVKRASLRFSVFFNPLTILFP